MRKRLKINPVTRIEGHLEVEVVVDTVDGVDRVVEAWSGSPMFRGFETILRGRDPRDAVHFTQRVCGVCPVSHGMAASLALEDAFGVTPAENGRVLRNLVLGANYIQSHILHFYHLAAPDYIDTTGILDMSPWTPRYASPDLVTGDAAAGLVGHYVDALDQRRKSHRMGAIFSGRQPSTASFVPGGCTHVVTETDISAFRLLLDELRAFIDGSYLPDVEALAGLFPEYLEVGQGCGNLLAYGVFDLDSARTTQLLARGRYTDQEEGPVDDALIKEYVAHAWYTAQSGTLHPAAGVTEPDPGRDGAYSWIKAPRYAEVVHEVGPLARMWVNGDYRRGISVIDRIAARAQETSKVAEAMVDWLDELRPGEPVYTHRDTPNEGAGVGMTEAPRGALGHWVGISDAKISNYQLVTPTGWNASPRDDLNRPGALEQALLGTPVREVQEPLEVLRVIHSFDPCVACSVHAVRPRQRSVWTGCGISGSES